MEFLRSIGFKPSDFIEKPKLVEEPKKPEFPLVDVLDFVKSSYTTLIQRKIDFDRLHFPFSCAVTPIPKNIDSIPVPTTDYEYKDAPICQNCRTPITKKTIIYQDNTCFLCNVCSTKGTLGINAPTYLNSPQLNVPVVDLPYTDEENQPIPIKNLFIFEKSSPTLESGLFLDLISKLLIQIKSLNHGFFSFFLLTNGLNIPIISKNRNSFSISSYPDSADVILPQETEKIFFDLSIEEEKNLLIKFIETVIEKVPEGIPTNTLLEIIDSVTSSYEKKNIFSTMVSSTANPGTIEDAIKLGNKLLQTNGHFDLFCMNPSPQQQPNYDGISEFSMLNNSHLIVFNPVQVQTIIDDILYRIFCQKSGRALIMVNIPPYFEVKNIIGCGLMRTHNSIMLTCIEPGDTVYFFFDYLQDSITGISPSMVFQMRLMGEDGRRWARIAVYNYSVNNNMSKATSTSNFDVVYASFMLQCIEHGRESNDDLKMQDEVDKLRKMILEDNFIKLMLCTFPEPKVNEVTSFFAVIKKLVNYVRSAEIMSKTPLDYHRFIIPQGYLMMLNTPNIDGPFAIHNYQLTNGALLIQIDDDHSVVLLADVEAPSAWVSSISVPPLSDIIAAYSTARSIEIMHPKLSHDSKVYITLMKCMTAPIEEPKKT